jgi:hypothetical protein
LVTCRAGCPALENGFPEGPNSATRPRKPNHVWHITHRHDCPGSTGDGCPVPADAAGKKKTQAARKMGKGRDYATTTGAFGKGDGRPAGHARRPITSRSLPTGSNAPTHASRESSDQGEREDYPTGAVEGAIIAAARMMSREEIPFSCECSLASRSQNFSLPYPARASTASPDSESAAHRRSRG